MPVGFIQWSQNYLMPCAGIFGIYLRIFEIPTGVPQGSHLELFVFILFEKCLCSFLILKNAYTQQIRNHFHHPHGNELRIQLFIKYYENPKIRLFGANVRATMNHYNKIGHNKSSLVILRIQNKMDMFESRKF